MTNQISLPPFAYTPKPYTGPSPAEVLAMRKEHLSPAIYHFYKNPIMIVEGKGQYLFDETGRRYLDGIGGIVTVSVGHCHPEVTAAANTQNETIVHTTTLYLNPQVALFAKELAAKMPGDLKVCYFVNSGSEANDLAIMMARAATGNYDVIALRNAYHGGSPGAMALTSHHTWKFNVPHSFGVQHAIMPDLYRGIYGADDANAGSKYAADVKSLIQYGTSGQVAAFIAETIQGVGGAVVMPEHYLLVIGGIHKHKVLSVGVQIFHRATVEFDLLDIFTGAQSLLQKRSLFDVLNLDLNEGPEIARSNVCVLGDFVHASVKFDCDARSNVVGIHIGSFGERADHSQERINHLACTLVVRSKHMRIKGQ